MKSDKEPKSKSADSAQDSHKELLDVIRSLQETMNGMNTKINSLNQTVLDLKEEIVKLNTNKEQQTETGDELFGMVQEMYDIAMFSQS